MSLVDEAKPYALAAVTVIHPEKNEEALLGEAPPPQGGDLLAVHLDASVEGEVVVVALHKKTGQLAHGWRPVLAVLKSWDELGLPPRGEKWVWPKTAEPFEVFVVFFAKGDPAAAAVRPLVAQLRDPATDAARLPGLARALREALQKWQARDTALAAVPRSAPVAVAGTVRTVGEFPWRTHARKANFSAGQPAVLVFRQ